MRYACRQSSAALLSSALLLAAVPSKATEAEPTTPAFLRENPKERQPVVRPQYRSPGLATLLSLTPIPVDFGNLYAKNQGWGMVYSGAEVALASGILGVSSGRLCLSQSDCGSWTTADSWILGSMIAGYVGVKIGAGIHAASAAESYNAQQRWIVGLAPTASGGAVTAAVSY